MVARFFLVNTYIDLHFCILNCSPPDSRSYRYLPGVRRNYHHTNLAYTIAYHQQRVLGDCWLREAVI